MTTNPDIVDRVKKLLRLARDNAATPAEAAQALNRAMKLITDHRIDAATLDLDEETEQLVCEHIHIGSRISAIKLQVGGILRRYFHVRPVVDYPRLSIANTRAVRMSHRDIAAWCGLSQPHPGCVLRVLPSQS